MRTRIQNCRSGYSLLDTLAAGTVLAIVLVPGYEAMRSGLEWSRDAEVLQTTTTLCVGKMEERLAIVAATFTSGTQTGSFAADGFSDYRYSVVSSDAAADGGIPDGLMVITATVWKDEDADTVLDTDEISTQFETKVAKMTTYVQ